MRSSFLLAGAALLGQSLAGYTLKEDFFDGDFFSHFDFFTTSDPTHGFVDYVSQSVAQQNGYINSTANSAWISADSKEVVQGNAGRKSVRIASKKSYTHMLVVLKVDKLPIACGSWPAFWTVGPNWPNQGEIDIIEGVHKQKANQMTLHTSGGCSAAGKGDGILNPSVTDCEGNQGCGFVETNADSFSDANSIGGGVWAMEWTSQGIKVWWWDSKNTPPPTVLTASPDPSGWGPPSMNVPNGGNCDIDQHFSEHQVIFDQTFCGDWAGQSNVWSSSGCSSSQFPTCQSFVANNPKAYAGLGWDVRYLKVFQQS